MCVCRVPGHLRSTVGCVIIKNCDKSVILCVSQLGLWRAVAVGGRHEAAGRELAVQAVLGDQHQVGQAADDDAATDVLRGVREGLLTLVTHFSTSTQKIIPYQ